MDRCKVLSIYIYSSVDPTVPILSICQSMIVVDHSHVVDHSIVLIYSIYTSSGYSSGYSSVEFTFTVLILSMPVQMIYTLSSSFTSRVASYIVLIYKILVIIRCTSFLSTNVDIYRSLPFCRSLPVP